MPGNRSKITPGPGDEPDERRRRHKTNEPTALEIVEKLRTAFPGWATLDEDVAWSQLDQEPLSRCGVLMALSFEFHHWVAANDVGAISRALAVVDELLTTTQQLPPGSPSAAYRENLYNDVVTCFLEGVVDDSESFRTSVLPNAAGAHVRVAIEREHERWTNNG